MVCFRLPCLLSNETKKFHIPAHHKTRNEGEITSVISAQSCSLFCKESQHQGLSQSSSEPVGTFLSSLSLCLSTCSIKARGTAVDFSITVISVAVTRD